MAYYYSKLFLVLGRKKYFFQTISSIFSFNKIAEHVSFRKVIVLYFLDNSCLKNSITCKYSLYVIGRLIRDLNSKKWAENTTLRHPGYIENISVILSGIWLWIIYLLNILLGTKCTVRINPKNTLILPITGV